MNAKNENTMSKRKGPAPCTTPRNNVRLTINDLRLVVDLLEVEAGINQAHVVYTPEQCVELANRLRWILVREREKENRQNEKR